LEKFSTTRHALGLYNNIALSAYYSKPEQSAPLESLIYKALAQVIQRISVLSVIPIDESKPTAYYARISTIDLRQAVIFVDREWPIGSDSHLDKDLKKVLNSQHNVDYKQRYGDVPFWRLFILRDPRSTSDFVACFVYSHSLGDGQSGLAFHRSFHLALTAPTTEPTSSGEFDPIITSPNTPMIPSLEDLHSLPLSILYPVSALWNQWFPKNVTELWRGKPISFADDTRKRSLTWVTIPSQKVTCLLTLSRRHAVTLTATLEAVLAATVLANLAMDYQQLMVTGAMSLRRFIPALNEDSFGNYVSRYVHHHHRSQSGGSPSSAAQARQAIWRDAQAVKTSIDAELGKNGKNSVVGLLRWAGPLDAFLKQKDNTPREGSFEVSNVGVFKYAQQPIEESWRIGEMIFSQSADVCGLPFSASIVTGGDGTMNIAFSWLESMLETGWIEKIIKDFRICVTDLVDSEY